MAKVKVVKKTSAPAASDTPAIEGKPVKKAKAAPKPSKYKGLKSGMRVMEYQDTTFSNQAHNMLTDEELCANWQAEFPNAVKFTPNHVAGARRDFNNGVHSKGFSRPESPVYEVIVDGGKKRFLTADEVRKTKAAKTAAKVEKTKATKAAKTPNKAANEAMGTTNLIPAKGKKAARKVA